MKAQIKHRIDLENRTNLETVIPLQLPFVLLVDPSSTCNFRCRFCPNGNRKLIHDTGRYQGLLNFELFQKIIDDLEDFPVPIKVLRLYKEGEPLLNPRLADMIRYAKRSKKILKVDTTTNGALLTPERNRQMIEAGIDQINISVNGVNERHFLELTNTHINFNRFVDNIRNLYENKSQCLIYIKIIKENISSDDQKRFFDIFGNMADRIFLEHLQPNWPNFEFNYIKADYQVGHYGQELHERQVCPFIFYMMVVNSDGSVSLCVQDWEHKLVVGDIRKQRLREIWQGAAIDAHRIAHLKNDRKNNATCRACSVMTHGALDNIDVFAPQLLKKFTNKLPTERYC